MFRSISLFVLIFTNQVLVAQCPSGDIILSNQNQVDSFRINYGCDTIYGNLFLAGGDIFTGEPFSSTDIYCLDSLFEVKVIRGILVISNNDSLHNLRGLKGLESANGGIFIEYNDQLKDLLGLENLDTIEGLTIKYNNNLKNLNGVDNIMHIKDALILEGSSLKNFEGLNNLESIGGCLQIRFNYRIKDFGGLENLKMVGGCLEIFRNEELKSLAKLENLAYIGGGLRIMYNDNLSECSINPICSYLRNPNGMDVNISNNKIGCATRSDIDAGCLHCPTGDIILSSQAEVDAFREIFPQCDFIPGSLIIDKYDAFSNITNLDSLRDLKYIGGSLRITSANQMLNRLNGLENLTSIGNGLVIAINLDSTGLETFQNLASVGGSLQLWYTNGLQNLHGLENLDSIHGELFIIDNHDLTSISGLHNVTYIGGRVLVWSNDNLPNLHGLGQLTYIKDNLSITNNPALTSLNGLENLDTIGFNLEIYGNTLLSECAIEPICQYLKAPNGTITIFNNKAGCNNSDEIRSACSSWPNCYSLENTWTGNANTTNWHDSHNWTSGIPTECHKVSIPNGSEVIITGPASCYMLTVENGAILADFDQELRVNCGN